jgi:hypothetical protein
VTASKWTDHAMQNSLRLTRGAAHPGWPADLPVRTQMTCPSPDAFEHAITFDTLNSNHMLSKIKHS